MKKFFSCLLATIAVITSLTIVSGSSFSDVPDNAWYTTAVEYCRDEGLFSGVGSNRFAPNSTMSRAMFVQVLYNLSGKGYLESSEGHFLDVNKGSWYYNSVEWAVSHSLVAGVGGYQFAPNRGISREEAATLLYRYMQRTTIGAVSGDGNTIFSDIDMVHDWAKNAMNWAISVNLYSGIGNGRLDPRGTLTRAQMAQLMMRIHKEYGRLEIIDEVVDIPVPDAIERYMYSMSTDELVGQVILPRFDYGKDSISSIERMSPAGVTLYANSFSGKTKAQVVSMVKELKSSSNTPLFIAVDEEGGSVVRVSSNKNLRSSPFKSVMDIYKSSGIDGIRKNTLEKSKFLLDLGINYNLAPVADITNNTSSYIYKRTVGTNAEDTSTVISTIVEEMNNTGICSSLKHFPGYGSSEDTHKGIAVDNRPLQSFIESDLKPFESGINSGATSVLISHNVVQCIGGTVPSSLSSNVVKLLREDLGFEGIIMTDDLSMGAIREYCNGKSPIVLAFKAGNDLLLTSDWGRDYNELLKAVNTGEISKSRLKESVRRILSTKINKGLLVLD